MADFNKVGLLFIQNDSFLVCRKDNYTSKLIMPGGQIDPGETVEDCLIREIHEELGNQVKLEDISYFGTYFDKAASDDPTVIKTVEIQLYKAKLVGSPSPSSEVIELLWFGKKDNQNELSAIIRNKILPDLIVRNEINWTPLH